MARQRNSVDTITLSTTPLVKQHLEHLVKTGVKTNAKAKRLVIGHFTQQTAS